MRKHQLTILHPAKETPAKNLPDGAITGNGDVTAVLAGTSDRVRIYIGKADFWKADGRVYTEHKGGIAPLGMAEILLPQLEASRHTLPDFLVHLLLFLLCQVCFLACLACLCCS